MAAAGKIRITLKRSRASGIPKQRDTLRALGLRRPNRSVVKPDTPVVRGMVDVVRHMVEVESVED
jgi:large subunit ribosomal protein L30